VANHHWEDKLKFDAGVELVPSKVSRKAVVAVTIHSHLIGAYRRVMDRC